MNCKRKNNPESPAFILSSASSKAPFSLQTDCKHLIDKTAWDLLLNFAAARIRDSHRVTLGGLTGSGALINGTAEENVKPGDSFPLDISSDRCVSTQSGLNRHEQNQCFLNYWEKLKEKKLWG